MTFSRPDLDWNIYRKPNKNAKQACANRYSPGTPQLNERRNSQNFLEPEMQTPESRKLYLQTNPDDHGRDSNLLNSQDKSLSLRNDQVLRESSHRLRFAENDIDNGHLMTARELTLTDGGLTSAQNGRLLSVLHSFGADGTDSFPEPPSPTFKIVVKDNTG